MPIVANLSALSCTASESLFPINHFVWDLLVSFHFPANKLLTSANPSPQLVDSFTALEQRTGGKRF